MLLYINLLSEVFKVYLTFLYHPWTSLSIWIIVNCLAIFFFSVNIPICASLMYITLILLVISQCLNSKPIFDTLVFLFIIVVWWEIGGAMKDKRKLNLPLGYSWHQQPRTSCSSTSKTKGKSFLSTFTNKLLLLFMRINGKSDQQSYLPECQFTNILFFWKKQLGKDLSFLV